MPASISAAKTVNLAFIDNYNEVNNMRIK